MKKSLLIVVSVLVAAGVVAVMVSQSRRIRSPRRQKLNVLLVTIDTTCADRLGCYGYAKARTPVVDSVAKSGVLFEQAFAPVPLTLPSHATLLTGLLPPEHGVHLNGENALGDDVPVLAQMLQSHGYRAGAFVAAAVLDSVFGLDRGFARYHDDLSHQEQVRAGSVVKERPANAVVDSALDWLTESTEPGDSPFFCWVHLFDPHFPYQPPAKYLAQGADPYDGEIAFADAQIGRLINWLDAQSLRETTLVVITSDHGESLGDHGENTHGLLVYGATLHVPLIFSLPDVLPQGKRVGAPAGLVDVLPTILDMLDLPALADTTGQSLVADMTGSSSPPRAYYGEVLSGNYQFGWSPLHSLTTSRWKFIRASQPELYDRRNDPDELNNLAPANPKMVAELDGQLDQIQSLMTVRDAPAIAFSDLIRSQIEALGYLSGGDTAAQLPIDIDGMSNPRDMMGLFDQYQDAKGLLMRGQLQEAIGLMEKVAAKSPASLLVQRQLSDAYRQAGDWARARTCAEKAFQMAPRSAQSHFDLGVMAVGQQRFEQACTWFRSAAELRPGYAAALSNLGLSLVELGRAAEAVDPYQQAIALQPTEASYHFNLALAYLNMGQDGSASRPLRRAFALNASHVQRFYTIADAALRGRKYEQAIRYNRMGHAIAPQFIGFANDLAWIFATCPQDDLRNGAEAVRLAQSVWQASAKQDPGLLDTLAVAYAQAGDMAKATEHAQRAVELASSPKHAALRPVLQTRVKLFQAGQPYRDIQR